jgi:hypothetical protein
MRTSHITMMMMMMMMMMMEQTRFPLDALP